LLAGHSLGILSQVDGLWLYLVIFLLIIVQEAGVPFPVLPSEVVLLSAGFLASQGKLALVVVGVVATGATLLGNSMLFYLSRRYGRTALDRYGIYLHLRPERIDRIEGWVSKRGTPIFLYGPLVPLLRAYIPALAGLFGVAYGVYIPVLLVAASIWSFGLLELGDLLEDHWYDAASAIRQHAPLTVLVCALIVTAGALVGWRRRRLARERAARE
jgi:membrane protein DedA with SNARE-associated domain